MSDRSVFLMLAISYIPIFNFSTSGNLVNEKKLLLQFIISWIGTLKQQHRVAIYEGDWTNRMPSIVKLKSNEGRFLPSSGTVLARFLFRFLRSYFHCIFLNTVS